MILLKGATTAMISRKAASPLLTALGGRGSSMMVVARTFHTPALVGSRAMSPPIQRFLVPSFGEKRTVSTNVTAAIDGTNLRILGTVTRTLQQLDSSVVMKIEEELKEVDKDADGL
jgi:hypothetical protein